MSLRKKKDSARLAKAGLIQTRFPRPIKKALVQYGRNCIPPLSANQANLRLIAEFFGFTVTNKKWTQKDN